MDLEGDGWGHGGSGHYYLWPPASPLPLEIFFRSACVINPIKIIIHACIWILSAKNYLNCNHSTLNDFYPLHFDLILTYWPFCPPPLAPVGWLLYLSCSPSTTQTHLPVQTISTKYAISLWIGMNINLTSFISYRYVITKFI